MNAHSERFNRTIQEEASFPEFASSIQEWNAWIGHYIMEYNCYRPHYVLDYRRPIDESVFRLSISSKESSMWVTHTVLCMFMPITCRVLLNIFPFMTMANADETKGSKYLLGQEHITDKEIDILYDLAQDLQLRLERFREYDKKYRELEEVNTVQAESERANLLNDCMPILKEVIEILGEMQSEADDVKTLFLKAKGALEAKVEMEKSS